MAFVKPISIRGYHCDAYGHVNNARYLEILEEARWDGLQHEGLLSRFEELGLQFFIVHIDISFKRAIPAGAEVEVHTSLHSIERKTVTFLQDIVNNGELACRAHVKFVLFDVKQQKAVPVTSEVESMFEQFRSDGES